MLFFYHSISEKSVIGIVKVIEKYQPDPTDDSGRFGMVIVKALKSLNKPVTLENIKSNSKLKGMPLIKQSRLSVIPIQKIYWNFILKMSETEN